MLDEIERADLNSSTKRPRTLSTPTADMDPPLRPFSRGIQMSSQQIGLTRSRPVPGVQYHEIQKTLPTHEIAQASGVPHYLVPIDWWNQFMKHVKELGDQPEDLNLGDLDVLKDGQEFRSDLTPGKDVKALQVETWSKIQEWYGQEDESCVRHSYKRGPGDYIIEFRPTDLYFSLFTPPNQFTDMKKLSIYRYKDVDGLYEKVRYAFGIDTVCQFRFWHATETQGLTNLNTAKEAIMKSHTRIAIGQVIADSTSFIVETRSSAAERWPLELKKQAQIIKPRALGTKGLINLGNTCYMASALQCLSHIKELTEYFLSKYYQTELNLQNPLGYSGKVASAFAGLLDSMYSEESARAVAPRELKTILGNINSSFGGYQQQDSQELLAFLLDALHEDLNRIVKKPATERPDIGRVSDEELLRLGEDAWNLHKMRNDSVIVDLFQGMYKSTLVCPICAHVSVTFDPFSDLSLPLPFRTYWNHDIYFVPLAGKVKRISLEFEQNASIGHIIAYLAKRYNLPPSHVAGTEVWKHKFYRIFESYMPVTVIERSDEAFFYELSGADPRLDKQSKNILIPVYTAYKPRASKAQECGLPLILVFDQEEAASYSMIQRKVLSSYQRFTTSSDLVDQPLDIHPEHAYDSEDDLAAPKTLDSSPLPFTLNVAPVKGETSFYDRKDPVPLSSRLKTASPENLATIEPQIDLDPQRVDITSELPSYDSAVSGDTADARSDIAMKDDSDDGLQDLHNLSDHNLTHFSQRPPMSTLLTPEPSPPSSSDQVSAKTGMLAGLLHDNEAIHCEWPELIYNEIFADEADGVSSKALWNDYDLEVDEHMSYKKLQREQSKGNTKSLEDCLDEFAKEEPLDAENTWYCPLCKEHQRANKTFELWRSGDILVFHLKRFSNSRSLSDKIDAEITFPVTGLSLNDRLGERKLKLQHGAMVEDSIYDLVGVVNHYGGLGGGHYTAFAQTFDSEGYRDFHNFNDSSVNPMEESNVVSSSAYLLFYRKRSAEPLGGNLRAHIDLYVQNQLTIQRDEHNVADRDSSMPPVTSPPYASSPATSSSGEAKESYVPFLGPGRSLGGDDDGHTKVNHPASNPFATGSWGAHIRSKVTTTNSETSEMPSKQLDQEDDALSWTNSD